MKVYRAPRGSALAQEKREKKRHALTGAHTTRPIVEGSMIRRWLEIAREHDKARTKGGPEWYLLLVLGFNTGLRISDLVRLTVRDVRGREDFVITEKKTGKEREIHLKWSAAQVITRALKDREPDEYVLQSRQRDKGTGQLRGISRQRAYEIIKEIAREAGYTDHVGCHTMRKTYALSMYDASDRNLALVQKALNHSSEAMTLHYIGLDQKDINDTVNKMREMF